MKTRYYLKGNFPVLISMFILFAVSVCLAEEITLTTYYPSPYGVYSEMRLYPKNSPSMPCDSEREGLMFYSDGSNVLYPRGLYVCGQNPLGGYGWNPISGLWSRDGTDLYPTDLSWNVGIGTTNPGTNKLSVAGTGRFTNTLYLDTQGTSSGQAIHAGRAIAAGAGLTGGGQLTSDRTISLDTSSISGCTDATNSKIYWGGSRLACGTDQGGGGGGGNITITAPGGSATGSGFNFVGNVTYSGGSTFTFGGGGGGGGGSVFSLTGGSGITLSGAGVAGNTWDPNAGTATIISSGGVGAVTPWFSPEVSVDNGDDMMINLGSPGQFSFCALAKHKENTGGDKDRAECSVKLSGTQWVLWAITRSDADATCGAICF